MKALKTIGLFLGLILGFALMAGIVTAVGAVGFFLGWILLAFFVFSLLFYGVKNWLSSSSPKK